MAYLLPVSALRTHRFERVCEVAYRTMGSVTLRTAFTVKAFADACVGGSARKPGAR